MSTFDGQFVEEDLGFIRADNFLPRNHSAFIFLLSHLHTDHMAGLSTPEFREVLEKDLYRRLFCSNLTREMLLKYKWCKLPPENIIGLAVNEAFTVSNPSNPRQEVTITPLPAGHCPGSVMFLLESEKCRVLYTGDVRITDRELKQLRPLHFTQQGVKPINHLYLDMTFCAPEYRHFPSRRETEVQIKDMVMSWLNESSCNRVALVYNSYFGLECLLIELAKYLCYPILVVNQESRENYRVVPELRHLLNPHYAKVHLCPVAIPCPVCSRIPSENLKKIKPCAMSFKGLDKDHSTPKLTAKRSGMVRVAYSCHSSLSELAKTVSYLQPTRIHPCAMPQNYSPSKCLTVLTEEIQRQKLAGELDTSNHDSVVPRLSEQFENKENDHRRSILWPKWAEDLENGAADSQEDSGVTSISLGSEEEFCVKRPRMMEESVCENQAQARSNDAVEEKEKVAIWSLLNLDSPPM